MVQGPVNRATLESNYQNPPELYDDKKTEACFELLADYIDGNYADAQNITTAKIANGAVTAAKLATDATVNESVNNVLINELKGDTVSRMINVKYPPSSLVAAFGDGSTNDSAAIQAIIDYLESIGGGIAYFPDGTYRVDDILYLKNRVFLKAIRGTVTIDFSNYSGWRTGYWINAEGEETAITTTLNGNASVGDRILSVASTTGFEANRYVLIASTESDFAGEGQKGELARIAYVDTVNGNLEISSRLFDTYSVSGQTVTITQLETITTGIEGIHFKGNGINPDVLVSDVEENWGDTAIFVQYGLDVSFKDCSFVDIENRCIVMQNTENAVVEGCTITFSKDDVRLQYGVALVGACQGITIRNNHCYNDRHFFTTAASNNAGCPRHVLIEGNYCYGSWTNAINTHRGAEFVTIKNNFISAKTNGINIRSRFTTIEGNTIEGRSDSKTYYGIGMNWSAAHCLINNNRFFRCGAGISIPNDSVDDTSAFNSFKIVNNELYDCLRTINIENTTGSRVAKSLQIVCNTIWKSRGWAIYVGTNIAGVIVDDNHIIDPDSDAIVIESPVGFNINNNIIEDAPAGQIALRVFGTPAGTHTTIRDNKFINWGGTGLSHNLSDVGTGSVVDNNESMTV